MKTYILRDPKTVEPHKARFVPAGEAQNPRSPGRGPALAATVDGICGPPASVPPVLAGLALFSGLDVHNDSIAVSLARRAAPRCGATGSLADNTTTCCA
jgi:hypothetical protein